MLSRYEMKTTIYKRGMSLVTYFCRLVNYGLGLHVTVLCNEILKVVKISYFLLRISAVTFTHIRIS
jgi:hypothetical protein